MSTDIRAGKRSRKILTIVAAVLAVALMLAVPMITAVDSDAAFTPDDAGFLVKSENPTDAEILTYSGETRAQYLLADNGVTVFLKIFDVGPGGIFNDPTVTQDKFVVSYGEGSKLESNSLRSEEDDELTVENVTMVFTASDDGVVIPESYEYLINYQAAGDAIKEYFGNTVTAGDKLTVTGNIKSRYATLSTVNYASVDDTKSVVKDQHDSFYFVYSVDVTIELKSGSAAGKTIGFHSDKKYMLERDYNVDYKGKAYSDLQPGDMCRFVNDPDRYSFESGGSYFSVNGANYGIEHDAFPPSTVDQPVNFITDSEMNLDIAKAVIAAMPGSSGNVTVTKTYEAVDTAVAEVAADVVLDDILKFVLIIVGVIIGIIVIIAILIIILVVRKSKKKKMQQ